MSQAKAAAAQAARLDRLARAASLVMALFLVSRVLGLLREVVIAHQFGTSAQMDAYLAAFRLPDFLFYLVAGGALGSYLGSHRFQVRAILRFLAVALSVAGLKLLCAL